MRKRPLATISVVSPEETPSSDRHVVFGFAQTPFGECLLGETRGGICHLAFSNDRAGALAELRSEWPNAELKQDDAAMAELASRIFDRSATGPIQCVVRGSDFQVRVWEALLQIPFGTVTTYGALAEAVGKPGAARAVGSAVGSNNISWLIPCHRVIPKSGGIGGYRWEPARKRAMIDWEKTRD